MTYRVVLDVNVLASAARSFDSPPGEVTLRGLRREYELVASEHILTTLDRVLRRPYFAALLPDDRRRSNLGLIRAAVTLVEPDESVAGIADDDEDDIVLGTAVAAGADHLVTGDQGLLAIGEHAGVRIVTARAFLETLDAQIP